MHFVYIVLLTFGCLSCVRSRHFFCVMHRLAMIGFAGILVTEALSGKTIPETYGLPHGTITGRAVGLLNMAIGFLHM